MACRSSARMLAVLGFATLALAASTDGDNINGTISVSAVVSAATAAAAAPSMQGRSSSSLRGVVNDTTVGAEAAATGHQGACVDQTGWETKFGDHMFQCGMQTLGRMPAAGACMAKLQKVSTACGACLGELISCGKQCLAQCCAGTCRDKPACIQCSESHCNPSFVACAGVSPP